MIDEAEFERQYTRHAAGVVKYMSYKFGAEDAEDLASAAWLKAWVHRGQFNGASSFKTWLIRIAINNGLEDRRRLRNRSETPMTTSLQRVTHDSNAVERGIIARDDLRRVVASVPKRDAEIFHMRYFLCLSTDDVAGRTRLKVSTVKTRMRRALIGAAK